MSESFVALEECQRLIDNMNESDNLFQTPQSISYDEEHRGGLTLLDYLILAAIIGSFSFLAGMDYAIWHTRMITGYGPAITFVVLIIYATAAGKRHRYLSRVKTILTGLALAVGVTIGGYVVLFIVTAIALASADAQFTDAEADARLMHNSTGVGIIFVCYAFVSALVFTGAYLVVRSFSTTEEMTPS